jgi:hypothetical protein
MSAGFTEQEANAIAGRFLFIYPVLIAWLPLKEGFKKDIAVYDFNPNGKTGVLTTSVRSVTKGTYKSLRSGERAVWIVTLRTN